MWLHCCNVDGFIYAEGEGGRDGGGVSKVKQSRTLFIQGSPFTSKAGLHRGLCILKKIITSRIFMNYYI